MKYKEFDMVRICKDYNEQIQRGAIGVVVMVYDMPNEAYEVEFVDDEGITIAQCVLLPNELEIVK